MSAWEKGIESDIKELDNRLQALITSVMNLEIKVAQNRGYTTEMCKNCDYKKFANVETLTKEKMDNILSKYRGKN